jgi:hypothetical protein
LDISLTGTGACVLPATWNPADPWLGIAWERFGAAGKLQGEERVEGILEGVMHTLPSNHAGVFYEEYSFSKQHGKTRERAELTGVIRRELFTRYEIRMIPIVASAARKLLFGKTQSMNTDEWKTVIKYELEMMGSPIDDADSRDAFVVANAGRHHLGMDSLMHPRCQD